MKIFENSCLLALLTDGSLRKFHMTSSLAQTRTFFSDLYSRYNEYSKDTYSYGYKNNYNELSYIENFEIEAKIINAIQDASSIHGFSLKEDDYTNIKYLFMGEHNVQDTSTNTVIVFQKIQKSQVVQRGNSLKLIAHKNTLSVYTDNLLSILDRLDCYYQDGRLYFNSMYFARQVFDMSAYIIEATNEDVKAFASDDIFVGGCLENLFAIADQTVRGKIKAIQNSGVLNCYSARTIQNVARKVGLNINIQEIDGIEKIALPQDKGDLKDFLKILDETIYAGILSGEWKESNSAKPYKRK